MEKLDALMDSVLCRQGANNIQSTVNAIMQLRIRAHLLYGRECDQAVPCFKEALHIYRNAYGDKHPEVLELQETLRFVIDIQNKSKK